MDRSARASLALLLLLAAFPSAAQEILLGDLYREAITSDPRMRQLELEAAQTELRLRNLDAERLPEISIAGEAQYQSDVIEFPFAPSGGTGSVTPPHDTIDVHVQLQQVLIDPARAARVASERARLTEVQAKIRTMMRALRHEVDEAFFTVLSLQEREAELEAIIRDLEARLRQARLHVEEGVALPGEAMTIEATRLRRDQDASELRARRRAALERLAALTGRDLSLDDRLDVPPLGDQVAAARRELDPSRRPEFAQFDRTRERLEAQKGLVEAEERLRLFAYGRAGYGRPGLNFLSDAFDAYWLAGVRMQWRPWNWGSSERERRILELQQETIDTEEEALVRSILRSLENDLAIIDHLAEALAVDARIVELREAIERETRARYEEREVTAAEYVDRQTDVLEARLLFATHRAELAQAQARLLTLLGWEVP